MIVVKSEQVVKIVLELFIFETKLIICESIWHIVEDENTIFFISQKIILLYIINFVNVS